VKPVRQRAILDIVAAQPVATQEELVAALKRQGLKVTQATVSRDIAELGLVRLPRNGHLIYALPTGVAAPPPDTAEARLRRLLREVPLRVRRSEGLAVLLTTAGAAQTVCAALDACGWPEVVGTVAGEDTIFVALSRPSAYERVLRRLVSLGATA
jgi:transcriptional regulator of arginine metabolism